MSKSNQSRPHGPITDPRRFGVVDQRLLRLSFDRICVPIGEESSQILEPGPVHGVTLPTSAPLPGPQNSSAIRMAMVDPMTAVPATNIHIS